MNNEKNKDTSSPFEKTKMMPLREIEKFLKSLVIDNNMTYVTISKVLKVPYHTVRNILNHNIKYMTNRSHMQMNAAIQKYIDDREDFYNY